MKIDQNLNWNIALHCTALLYLLATKGAQGVDYRVLVLRYIGSNKFTSRIMLAISLFYLVLSWADRVREALGPPPPNVCSNWPSFSRT